MSPAASADPVREAEQDLGVRTHRIGDVAARSKARRRGWRARRRHLDGGRLAEATQAGPRVLECVHAARRARVVTGDAPHRQPRTETRHQGVEPVLLGGRHPGDASRSRRRSASLAFARTTSSSSLSLVVSAPPPSLPVRCGSSGEAGRWALLPAALARQPLAGVEGDGVHLVVAREVLCARRTGWRGRRRTSRARKLFSRPTRLDRPRGSNGSRSWVTFSRGQARVKPIRISSGSATGG